jgi:hypothetical protein
VLDDEFQRDPRCGAAPDGVDHPGGGVGNQRTQLRRHHRLGAGRGPTRSAMASPTPWLFWMRFRVVRSGLRWSMRCGVACSKTH